MMSWKGLFPLWVVLFTTICAPGLCRAQSDMPVSPPMSGFIEASYSHGFLSSGNSDWNDGFVRGNLQLAPGRNLNGEISQQDHFDDQGTFIGLGYTHDFNESWYGFIGAGTSSGGFFLPRFRIDANLYRKWLEKKNLVTSIGFTYYKAKDVYSDRTLLLGCTYYFDFPLIIELGGRLNESNPGSVYSARGFVALTQGEQKKHYVTLRYESGREAYQLIGNESVISGFSSYEAGLNVRQWIGKDYGVTFRATYYENPSYHRNNLEGGIFVDF